MIKLQLIGHLGHDAVQRNVNGHTVLGFRVAHTERFKARDGELQERTTWVDCSLWNKEKVGPYLKTGTRVFVEGNPSADNYVNGQGENVSVLRLKVLQLQLLTSRRDGGKRENEVEEIVMVNEDPADDLPF
ncbi:single-stranded DNA-binding protein [Chitinophaga pinensis]|uniref:Single-stranded DNA-binding protein n=1 Tax=Chitinophaga pinensis (strain ATCC 43595 / DSM 2588 / LMG 13176 / NBRC 15968 / NCIMB 11800 / UQM 2034) TaxID=485918 RepID=A0A979H112_CHIPD|nr:single-stranded DNA-binding protein [Chitinophaga pinensis]ACU63950.1 single-strand binding protein [Chitinophaga pinensis DSM 2588]